MVLLNNFCNRGFFLNWAIDSYIFAHSYIQAIDSYIFARAVLYHIYYVYFGINTIILFLYYNDFKIIVRNTMLLVQKRHQKISFKNSDSVCNKHLFYPIFSYFFDEIN